MCRGGPLHGRGLRVQVAQDDRSLATGDRPWCVDHINTAVTDGRPQSVRHTNAAVRRHLGDRHANAAVRRHLGARHADAAVRRRPGCRGLLVQDLHFLLIERDAEDATELEEPRRPSGTRRTATGPRNRRRRGSRIVHGDDVVDPMLAFDLVFAIRRRRGVGKVDCFNVDDLVCGAPDKALRDATRARLARARRSHLRTRRGVAAKAS